jgi:hypothetical protein
MFKPNLVNIVSNVIVRDYIQYFWQVATDIVNLNSDGKNKYELRREAEKLITDAIDEILKNLDYQDGYNEYCTIEVMLCMLWLELSRHCRRRNIYDVEQIWMEYLCQIKRAITYLEDEYTRRLNQLIDKSNAS